MSTDTAANDPYALLGVARTATDAEIRTAYRALARKLHPDLNPGDTALEERFKAVSAAHEFLRDPERRRRYDAGEIDASGAEKPERRFYRHYADADAGGGQRYQPGGDAEDIDDLIARAFGRGGRDAGAGAGFSTMRFRGGDIRYRLEIAFLDAVNGATQRVATPDGGALDITIPPGVRDGQTLRLAGRGQPGLNEGPPGDALVEITVAPDPLFARDGDDIRVDLPISIDEAVLGATIDAPTPSGRVRLRVPPGSSSGKVLRLKGKGVRRARGGAGDMLVTLAIVLPEAIDDTLRSAIRVWREAHPQDPRKNWKGRAS